MAVLLNRHSFVITLLLATSEMKVILDFCVMIFGKLLDYIFIYKIKLGCYSCLSTEYSMLHHTFIQFITNYGDCVNLYSNLPFLFTQEKTKVHCSFKQLSASSNICTFRYIATGLMI